MPRRLLSAGAFLPVCLCLLAGYLVASCCAASALLCLLSHSRLSLPSSTPNSLFVPAGCCVASYRTASASRCAAGSRVASCGTFVLHPPAHPLMHRHFRRPLSWRRSHCRHPQMHGALSRRRHCQRPATVPSCTALVLQHVRLRRRIIIFIAQPSTILAQLSSYLG